MEFGGLPDDDRLSVDLADISSDDGNNSDDVIDLQRTDAKEN